MKRDIIITRDGSHTIEIPELNVTYHSHHGAVQESMHVFIETGLLYQLSHFDNGNLPLHVFEMGFGTGLNAFLTATEAERRKVNIKYTAVEKNPLSPEEANLLNYSQVLGKQETFRQIHLAKWGEYVPVNPYFTLCKAKTELQDFASGNSFDLIYYDAFAPSAQPELWTEEIFKKLYNMTSAKGALVTYCSKGSVRRAMQAAGFTVTKLPGPPGKREIVRAERSS